MITGAGTGIGVLASRTLAQAGHASRRRWAPDERNAECAAALRDSGASTAGQLHVIPQAEADVELRRRLIALPR